MFDDASVSDEYSIHGYHIWQQIDISNEVSLIDTLIDFTNEIHYRETFFDDIYYLNENRDSIWLNIGYHIAMNNLNYSLGIPIFIDTNNIDTSLVLRFKVTAHTNNSAIWYESQIYEDVFEYCALVECQNNISIEYIPKKYEIISVYPNPFNSMTKIKYSVSENAQLSIFIYDINGNIVSELINQNQSVGAYNIIWNAEGYPSGVYFVKLDAGEFTQKQKLMLIK